MQNPHQIQLHILKNLLFSEDLTYTKLKDGLAIENNQFDFHLKQLMKKEYVIKDDGGYHLTLLGKEYASRIDTDTLEMTKQAKISVVVCCVRMQEEREFLVYTRMKHPFYGCQGFMSGKVNYGESITQASQRELQEETGLSGEAEAIELLHFRNYDSESKNIIEDKFMFVVKVENPSGELMPNNEGLFEWVKQSQLIQYIQKPFTDIQETLKIVALVTQESNDRIPFQEIAAFPKSF